MRIVKYLSGPLQRIFADPSLKDRGGREGSSQKEKAGGVGHPGLRGQQG